MFFSFMNIRIIDVVIILMCLLANYVMCILPVFLLIDFHSLWIFSRFFTHLDYFFLLGLFIYLNQRIITLPY